MSEYLIEQNIQMVLKNGPKIETIPSFDQRDQAESTFIIRHEF